MSRFRRLVGHRSGTSWHMDPQNASLESGRRLRVKRSTVEVQHCQKPLKCIGSIEPDWNGYILDAADCHPGTVEQGGTAAPQSTDCRIALVGRRAVEGKPAAKPGIIGNRQVHVHVLSGPLFTLHLCITGIKVQ
jgi:hypothetical protein